MGPRAGLSTILIAGALVLLVAIMIGNNMGNRVLGQVSARLPPPATEAPAPTPSDSGDAASWGAWKHERVLSVATDPGFPDPRVTPEPSRPPESPRPRPTPTLTPSPGPRIGDEPAPSPSSSYVYTSPPMPIPLVTHLAPGGAPPPGGATPLDAPTPHL
jgi:hypothetical protein